MSGAIIDVWPHTWSSIWTKLGAHPAAPPDFFGELYSELAESLTQPLDAQLLAERTNDPHVARYAFRRTRTVDFKGERAIVAFLEAAFRTVRDSERGAELGQRYFDLLTKFIRTHNLRYELRQPGVLSPTLPGIFASFMSTLKTLTASDAHLATLMADFELSLRDLRIDCSDACRRRVKTDPSPPVER